MLKAKLVPGASEFVELDGQLAVVLGTAGALISAWEELAGSLRWPELLDLPVLPGIY